MSQADVEVARQAHEASGGSVVLRMELRIEGTGSGVGFPGEFTQVVDVVDGKLRRGRAFFTFEEALEAVDGLS